MIDAVWTELRFAARTQRKAPSFAATAALTIALGVGASTAVFSVVYGILFRPLPYRDANRLVVIAAERDYSGRPRPEPTNFSLVDYEEWRSRSQSFDSIAFMTANTYALSDSNGSRPIDASDVTASFFRPSAAT